MCTVYAPAMYYMKYSVNDLDSPTAERLSLGDFPPSLGILTHFPAKIDSPFAELNL